MLYSDNGATIAEIRFLSKVAYLYYQHHQKQSQIAEQLDISGATVSRLLKRAEDMGIVRISVNMLSGVYPSLESDLCAYYGLKAAVVVHCDDADEEMLLHHIGSAAAYYVETTLSKNEVVGLSSWSSALLAMVNSMHPLEKPLGTKVVQILGGMGNPSAESYATRITERFASLVRGEAIHFPAPGVVGSKVVRDQLVSDPFVSHAISLFGQVTLALVGIGSVVPSKLLASSGNIFSQLELDALRTSGGRVYGPGGAAHRLGLNPTTLYGKMKKHGIARTDAG